MLKIASYNFRGSWTDDGINSLPHRLGAMLDKIDNEQPDVICFQEAFERFVTFFKKHVPDYMVIYNGRTKNYDGEGLMVALRKETIDLLSSEFFWLSPTPYVPASRFKGQSDCPRVTQAVLVRRRGETEPFWVYNNHLDHISDQARLLGVQALLTRITADQEKCVGSVYILGDFNALPDSEPIKFCNSYEPFPLVDTTHGLGGTYHGFGGDNDNPLKLDYIYTNAENAKHPYTVERWLDEQDGVYLSDHYPVCLTIDN